MDYTSGAYWKAAMNASLCKFLILRAVCEEPTHGYGIIRRVAKMTGDLCTPSEGTVYPALWEFEKCGCVRCSVAVVRGRERKVYTATPKGRRSLDAGMDVWRRVLAHLQAVVRENPATMTP